MGRGAGGQHEVLAVPTHSRGEKRTRSARRSFLIEGTFDAPIVRHIDRTPCGIGELRLVRSGRIGLQEEPAGIEWQGGPRRGGQRNHRENEHRQFHCALATSTAKVYVSPNMLERNTTHFWSGVKLTFGSSR